MLGYNGRSIVVFERSEDGRLRAADQALGVRTEPTRGELLTGPAPASALSPGSIGAEGDDPRARAGGGPARKH